MPNINVTPMIDVLLVLLIIFMLITPLDSVGFEARVPPPSQDNNSLAAPTQDVVLSVHRNNIVDIQEAVSTGDLPDRLALLFRTRGDRVIFLRGDKDLDFEPVAQVIDMARGAGLTRIALMKGE